MPHKPDSTSQKFLITGASSGLGLEVANQLIAQGHEVILVARRKSLLEETVLKFTNKATYLAGDLTDEKFINQLIMKLPLDLSGVYINAGGPPAKLFSETTLTDWDEAYKILIRWKVLLIQNLLPIFKKNNYGRIILSESTSINRPVKNLVLSNSLRMTIIGLVKTLVMENQKSGITFNILAPGYHETKALERLYEKLSIQEGISIKQAKDKLASSIPTGETGSVEDFASLVSWLLCSKSSFVTGQIFTIDGGVSI